MFKAVRKRRPQVAFFVSAVFARVSCQSCRCSGVGVAVAIGLKEGEGCGLEVGILLVLWSGSGKYTKASAGGKAIPYPC